MVVDSSVWLEIALNGPLASSCEREISKGQLFVPALVIYEVYRKGKQKLDEAKALEIIGAISACTLVDLTREVALLAADLSLDLGMAMADSIVLAHAHLLQVPLLTLDNDFTNIPGAVVLRK